MTPGEMAALDREYCGELPWDDVRQTRGLALLLRTFKLDRTVMYTAPVWAIKLGKALLAYGLPTEPAYWVLAWCRAAQGFGPPPGELYVFQRAAAVMALLRLEAEVDDLFAIVFKGTKGKEAGLAACAKVWREACRAEYSVQVR